jgi:hypothetical protein
MGLGRAGLMPGGLPTPHPRSRVRAGSRIARVQSRAEGGRARLLSREQPEPLHLLPLLIREPDQPRGRAGVKRLLQLLQRGQLGGVRLLVLGRLLKPALHLGASAK